MPPDKNIQYCESPINVLIVDDNESNIFVLQSYAKLLHFPYDIASNGNEAVEKVKISLDERQTFSIIFMDINMPIMNGIEATNEIRKMEKDRNKGKTKIFALTAADTEKSLLRTQFSDIGFDKLLGKPLSKLDFQRNVSGRIIKLIINVDISMY